MRVESVERWRSRSADGRAKRLPRRTLAMFMVMVAGLSVASPAQAYIYWTTAGFNGPVGRANNDGTAVNPNFITANTDPIALTIDQQHIYITEFGETPSAQSSSSMERANIDGTGVYPGFILNLPDPGGVAVDAQHVYWTNGGDCSGCGPFAIERANLDGSGVNTTFITAASEPNAVAVDGQHVYWTNGNTSTIGRANLDGSGANENFIRLTSASLPRGLAVDGQHIYWTENNSLTNTARVGRANLDGTGVNESFVSNAGPFPLGMAVDGQHVYWGNGGAGIWRANLDGSNVVPAFIHASAFDIAVDNGVPTPVDLTPPSVAGPAVAGQALTAVRGSWSNGPTGYAYQWMRCDGAGGNCSPIANAAGQMYSLVPADVGSTIRVRETASNIYGARSAMSAPTPVVTLPPAPICGNVSSFSPQVSDAPVAVILSCSVPTGTALNYAVVSAPGHGTLVAFDPARGIASYMPAPGFSGADSFTYRAGDLGGTSNIATVTISVPAPSIAVGSTAVSGASAAVRVACRGRAGQTCAGMLTVTARVRERGAKVVAVGARHRHKPARRKTKIATVTVATGSYRVAAEHVASVAVTLTAAGKRLLSRFYRLPTTMRLAGSGSATTAVDFVYLRIKSTIDGQFSLYGGGYTTFDQLTIQGLPAKAQVAISCRGPGCTPRVRVLRAHGSALNVARPLGPIHLRPGAKVQIAVTSHDRVGDVKTYTIASGALPTANYSCLPPGTHAPSACVA